MPAVGDLVLHDPKLHSAWIYKVVNVNLDAAEDTLPIELEPFINLHLHEEHDLSAWMFQHAWSRPSRIIPVPITDLCSLRLRLDKAINEYVKERSE
jgi:hypothetical protein